MSYRIGLDVGGTNTDAVLMSGRSVLAWTKTPTTTDVESGVLAAVQQLLSSAEAAPGSIAAVMIGTTQFTNALVQRRGLGAVAGVRIGLPSNTGIPVGAGWPAEIAEAVRLDRYMIHGGHNFDGEAISELDPAEIDALIAAIDASGARAVALNGVFSTVSAAHELEVGRRIADALPGIDVSLAHQIGKIGLLERENATILNASLMALARRTFRAFEDAFATAGVDAPIFISQNDGTVMNSGFASRFPVRTLSSGPTNSMRGAAFLSGIDDGLVLDIGGTTSDAGALIAGFPREAPTEFEIEGVRTNFRMPDVLSIGVGGGSIVTSDEGGPGSPDVEVGPQSVGYRLTEEARVFGGETLTATDVAVAAGFAEVGDPATVADLDPALLERAITLWHAKIDELLAKVRGSAEPVPLVLVGGGAFLVDATRLTGVTEVVVPPFNGVANAVGAAIPQASGEVDRVVSFAETPRDEAIAGLRAEAIRQAVEAGADESSVAITDEDVIQLTLLIEGSVRIRIRAVGEVHADDFARLGSAR